MSASIRSIEAGYQSSTWVKWYEVLPFLAAGGVFFALPDYLALGSRVLIFVLFALSLDLVVGFAGIVTLGHAAFFGAGAYAAGFIGAYTPVTDPILQTLGGALAAGLVGLATGAVVLRTEGLARIMLTLAFAAILLEVANKFSGFTGGTDGLSGITVSPLLGRFEFDLYGQTGYLYCLAAVFFGWVIVRRLVYSPFGLSLTGIRDNAARMHALGAPVYGRLLAVYTISAVLAGAAGALLAEINQLVGLDVLSFSVSGEVLVMLILGGVGRIYGAFLGPAIFLVLQDALAKQFPEFWYLGVGVVLIVVVWFAPEGIAGLIARLARGIGGSRA